MPDKKNFLLYDADCGFCQRSVNTLQKIIGNKIDYIPNNQIEDGFYRIDKKAEVSSIKFIEFKKEKSNYNEHEKFQHYDNHDVFEDAILYHGAYAIFKALSYNHGLSFILFFYDYFPFFDLISEACYRIIARNRQSISQSIGATGCKVN